MEGTWQVLITSIPHRHEKLLRLLDGLDSQRQPGFGALLYRDDLEVPYGDKTQALLEAATADYVSCVDDDDMLAPGAVAKIMDAIAEQAPDYVGFHVDWTRDGVPQRPVVHSLRYGTWQDRPEQLERDITQFNPVRRELALLGTWEGGWEAERRWAAQLRDSGRVKREAFIPEPLYQYRESQHDTFKTGRKPLGIMGDLPSYPWLRQIGPYA
jgi:hypothetical protein